MSPDTEAAIIANDLDSLARRIESLPTHPRFTAARELVEQACAIVQEARRDIRNRGLAERHPAAVRRVADVSADQAAPVGGPPLYRGGHQTGRAGWQR